MKKNKQAQRGAKKGTSNRYMAVLKGQGLEMGGAGPGCGNNGGWGSARVWL